MTRVNESERLAVISQLSAVIAMDTDDEGWFSASINCIDTLFVWSKKPEVLMNVIMDHMINSNDWTRLIHICSHTCLKLTLMMDEEISTLSSASHLQKAQANDEIPMIMHWRRNWE